MKDSNQDPSQPTTNVIEDPTNTISNQVANIAHFHHESFKAFQRNNPERIRENLEKFNCDKRIFNGQDEYIFKIAVWKKLIFTLSTHALHAWNTETGEIVWKYDADIMFSERLYIHDNNLIFSGKNVSERMAATYDKPFIAVIDCATLSEVAVINELNLAPESIIVLNNNIIGKLPNGCVNCWNLSGELVNSFSSNPKLAFFPKLYATEQYIADVNNKIITVIQRSNGKTINIEAMEGVYSATLQNNKLICGLEGINPNRPDIIVIDLPQAKIIDFYKTTDQLLNYVHPVYGTTFNCGTIRSVVAYENDVLMSHENGKVVIVDLHNRSHKLFTTSEHSNAYLSLQDNYLLMRSDQNNYHVSTVTIWDINSLKQVHQLELSKIHDALWHKGSLYVSSEASLEKYDFKILHQNGIQLHPDSPTERDYAIQSNCLVM